MMSLRRQSALLFWLAALTLTAVIAVLGWSAVDVQSQTTQNESAQATASGVSHFRFLILETALYREARTLQQWDNSVKSFRTLLNERGYTDDQENALREQVRVNLDVMVKQYMRLTGPGSVALGHLQQNGEAIERTASTVSALYQTTQDMLDESFELVRLNQADIEVSHNRAAITLLVSIAALMALTFTYHQINRRRVLAPIAELQKGTEQVLNGDLSYQLDMKIGNELGLLGRTFDRMTLQLGQSYAALEAENAERRKAQDGLEASVLQLASQGEALAHARQELQTIIDHLPALVAYWDASLHNRFANAAHRDWIGLTPQQMQGQHKRNLSSAESYSAIEPFLHSALQGNTETFEREIVSPTGQIRQTLTTFLPDIVDGVLVGVYSFSSDITPLRQAQAGQAEALATMEQTFDAASDFAIIVTALSGTIKLFSHGAQRMLGYRAKEIIDVASPVLFHDPAELAERDALLAQELGRPVRQYATLTQLALNGQSDSREWIYVRKDGSKLPVNLTITPMFDVSGRVSGFLGIAKDIREERAIRSSLADARDQAEAANRAKSQFLATMSHELRTPMTAILGMLQLLQYTRLDGTQRDYTVKSENAARALLLLLNDILDFSKLDAERMQLDVTPFAVDHLLRELGVILSATLGDKPVELVFELDPAVPAALVGDVQRLRQVLINLAGNALKFTESGEVVVSLRLLATSHAASTIEFSVRDTGIGIAADQLGNIFHSFNQAEASISRRFGGSGLGLSISQRLVALMGGELSVESQLGSGSRFGFSVTLPHAQRSEVMQALAVVEQAPVQPVRRALIIDDNQIACAVLLNMVTALGWQGEVALSGAEGLAILHSHPGGAMYFDLILVDWNMPEMDGWEVTRQIRHRHAEVPLLIMVTAYGRSALAERIESDSNLINGFLVKPVTASMLADAVNNAGGAEALLQASPLRPGSDLLAGLRLLVVDDNPVNLQIARELLMHEGAQVSQANGGAIAETMVLAADPQYDAVLMDVQMPDVDGHEATRRLRTHPHLQQLPIIAMTANVMQGDRDACLAAGMNEHVGKPIDVRSLVKVLLQHCRAATSVATEVAAEVATEVPAATSTASGSATGIAVDLALARLGGNAALYVELIAHFVRNADVEVTTLHSALQNSDAETALRILHTLKGTAGTLGADALAACAAQTSVAWQQDGLPADAILVLAPLQRQVTEAAAALQIISARISAAARAPALALASTPTPSTAASATGMPALAALLTRFEALLAASSMEALEQFAQVRAQFPAQLGSHAAPIAAALEQMDFPQALAACRHLRIDMGVDA